MPGPSPQPTKRRRYNTPKSYGAAEPVTAPAAEISARELGIDGTVHPLVRDMWRVAGLMREQVFQCG